MQCKMRPILLDCKFLMFLLFIKFNFDEKNYEFVSLNNEID